MERTADPEGSDVAVADSPQPEPFLPPQPGAFLPPQPEAEVLYRRPPAENSFPEVPDLPHRPPVPEAPGRYQDRQAEAWEAFAPSYPRNSAPESRWESSGEVSAPLPEDFVRRDAVEIPGPARGSFGVADGPISPSGLAAEAPPREHPAPPVRRRRSKPATAFVSLLAVLVLLAAGAGGVAYFSESGRALLTSALSGGTPQKGTAAVPVGGRTTATFVLAAAAPAVTVRTADLGDDLFRIAGAPGPAVTGDRVELRLIPDGGKVEVQLSRQVAWSVQLSGGSETQLVDLTGGAVKDIDLSGSSDRTELVLPGPKGTVPIEVTGSVGDLTVTAPAEHPVRVKLDSGAATVTAGARTLRDVAPGSTLTPKNWKTQDRYDLDAASRIGTLTIKSAKG